MSKVLTITGTTPASESTAVVGSTAVGLQAYQSFTIHADLVGATGGTLNVRLQRRLGAEDKWSDWVSFPQLAGGASAIQYALECSQGNNSAIAAVGGGTTASPTAALGANTSLGGHPGTEVRAVATAGSGTSAGAVITIRIIGNRHR